MLFMVAVACIIIFLFQIRLAQQRKRAGIQGWLVSQDLDGRSRRVYRNNKIGISCKPDVLERKRLIEYKSASLNGKSAKTGDVLQVAAQMMATGVNEAELRYAKNRKFFFRKESPQIQEAMRRVSRIVSKMRWHLRTHIPPRGTPSLNRCSVCRFNRECSESLL